MTFASLLVFCLLLGSAFGEDTCNIGQEDGSLLQVRDVRGVCSRQYEGCNNQGHNLGKRSASDATTCQAACAAESNCIGWTFINSNNGVTTQCWLKDSGVLCPGQGMQCNQNDQWNQYWSGFCHGTCGSGPTPTPPPPTPSPSGGCSRQYQGCNNQGHNLGKRPASDATTCQAACAAESNCMGWTFINSNNGVTTQCWLKDSGVLCAGQGMQCNQNDQWNQYWSGFCHGACGSGPTPTPPPPTPSPTPPPTTGCASPGFVDEGGKCEYGSDGYFHGCCKSHLVCTKPSTSMPGEYSRCQYPPPTPTPAPTNSGCSRQYQGCNNQGRNLGKRSASDATTCQAACAAESTCMGWTFINSNNGVTTQCWLKDSGVLCPGQGMQCNQNDQWNQYWSGFCHGACGNR